MEDADKEIKVEKKICSFFKTKLAVIDRYLSITEKMEKSVRNKNGDKLALFLSERRKCIKEIEKIDPLIKLNMDMLNKVSDRLKRLIDDDFVKIREIMKKISCLDDGLTVMVKEETMTIKSELLSMKGARKVTRGYTMEKNYSPRFLDTVR